MQLLRSLRQSPQVCFSLVYTQCGFIHLKIQAQVLSTASPLMSNCTQPFTYTCLDPEGTDLKRCAVYTEEIRDSAW